MSHHEETKKEKQRKKNRKAWELFLNFARLNDNVDVAAPESKPKLGNSALKKEAVPNSPKVMEIRNRLTNKREKAEERWNRFAGTADGGGRGR